MKPTSEREQGCPKPSVEPRITAAVATPSLRLAEVDYPTGIFVASDYAFLSQAYERRIQYLLDWQWEEFAKQGRVTVRNYVFWADYEGGTYR